MEAMWPRGALKRGRAYDGDLDEGLSPVAQRPATSAAAPSVELSTTTESAAAPSASVESSIGESGKPRRKRWATWVMDQGESERIE